VTDPVTLRATESGLWSLLEPYRATLEHHDLYGLPSLRWPGAKAHDFFAGVRRTDRHVALHLMPVLTHPDTLEGLPSRLKRLHKGKTTFNFTDIDDELLGELVGLVERCYAAYAADHAG
jgi:hypothetical protein